MCVCWEGGLDFYSLSHFRSHCTNLCTTRLSRGNLLRTPTSSFFNAKYLLCASPQNHRLVLSLMLSLGCCLLSTQSSVGALTEYPWNTRRNHLKSNFRVHPKENGAGPGPEALTEEFGCLTVRPQSNIPGQQPAKGLDRAAPQGQPREG